MQKGVLRKHPVSPISEYGRQLQEKQGLKKMYHLREKQFKKYITRVLSLRVREGNSPDLFIQQLENRLDNVVFRMGMAQSRAQARQMVNHGHFLVNKRGLDIPSYQVRKGDHISVHPSSLKTTLFKNIQMTLKKYEAPTWIQLNKETMEATIVGTSSLEEAAVGVDIPLIFAFYSR